MLIIKLIKNIIRLIVVLGICIAFEIAIGGFDKNEYYYPDEDDMYYEVYASQLTGLNYTIVHSNCKLTKCSGKDKYEIHKKNYFKNYEEIKE